MIHNAYDVDGAKAWSLTMMPKPPKEDHRLITAKKGCKWMDGEWKKVFNNEYQKVKCCHPDCKITSELYAFTHHASSDATIICRTLVTTVK